MKVIVSDESRFIGYIDNIENGVVTGWAIDRHAPAGPTFVDVYLDNQFVGQAATIIDRPDLKSISPASITRGFRLDVSRKMEGSPLATIKVMHSKTLHSLPFSSENVSHVQLDMNELILAKPSPWTPVPTGQMIQHISGDADPKTQRQSYLTSGMINAADVVNVCYGVGLQPRAPDFAIVDLGCGSGRLASFLAQYLPGCTYHGVDVQASLINWASENVSARIPNFRFSALTAADGYIGNEGFPIPAASRSVDLVMATSLFTHLDKGSSLGYFKEIERCLRPCGLAYITFFLLDEITEPLAENAAYNAGAYMTKMSDLWHFGEGGYLDVFYRTTTIESLIRQAGLEIQFIRRGYWGGRQQAGMNPAAYQDLLIARLPRKSAS